MAVTANPYNHLTQLIASQAITLANLRLMKLTASASFNAAHTTVAQVANGASQAVTISIASPGKVSWNAHGFAANTPIILKTTGALPTGLAANTIYYVRNPGANDFELSATSGGASINTSGGQSGVHTAYSNGSYEDYGNGWSPFGEPVANVAATTITTNDSKLAGDQTSKTASGGSIGARHILLFDLASMKPLIFYDLGQTEAAGDTTDFKVTFDLTGTPGQILTLTV